MARELLFCISSSSCYWDGGSDAISPERIYLIARPATSTVVGVFETPQRAQKQSWTLRLPVLPKTRLGCFPEMMKERLLEKRPMTARKPLELPPAPQPVLVSAHCGDSRFWRASCQELDLR